MARDEAVALHQKRKGIDFSRGPDKYDEPKDVAMWMGRIKAAQAKRRWFFKTVGNKCEDWLSGLIGKRENPDDTVIMLILPSVETEKAQLFFDNPHYELSIKRGLWRVEPGLAENMPRKAIMEAKTALANALLEHHVKDTDGQSTFGEEISMVMWDAAVGFGVAQEDYDPVFRTNERGGRPLEISKGVPMLDKKTGEPVIEPDRLLFAEHFPTRWVNSRMYLIDSQAMAGGKNAEWDGVEWWKPWNELKENPNLDAVNLRPMTERKRVLTMREQNGIEGRNIQNEEADLFLEDDDPKARLIHGYTIYHWPTRRILVLCENNLQKFLMNASWHKGMEASPLTRLVYTQPKNTEFYGMIPPVWPMIAPQKHYNEGTKHILILFHRTARKYFIQKGSLNRRQMDQLISNVDGEVIEVENLASLRSIIEKFHDDATPSIDRYVIEKSFQDLIRAGGQPGEVYSEETAPTLGQSQLADVKSRTRQLERRRALKNFLIKTGWKKWQNIQHLQRGDMAVKVTMGGREMWVRVEREDVEELHEQYGLDLDIESGLPPSEAVEAAQVEKFAKDFIPPQVILKNVDTTKVTKKLLKSHHLLDSFVEGETAPAMGSPVPDGTPSPLGPTTEPEAVGAALAGIGVGGEAGAAL